MKTPDEIAKLKREWENDPCWDIEDTDGFSEHYEELLDFRLTSEAFWDQQRQEELEEFARSLGTDNLKLAEYIMRLGKV